MRAPTKEEADKLARTHEKAATLMRQLAKGEVNENEAQEKYLSITNSVDAILSATEAWRRGRR